MGANETRRDNIRVAFVVVVAAVVVAVVVALPVPVVLLLVVVIGRFDCMFQAKELLVGRIFAPTLENDGTVFSSPTVTTTNGLPMMSDMMHLSQSYCCCRCG